MQILKKDLIDNSSRRSFLSIITIGVLSLTGALYLKPSPEQSRDQEEFILVNGWVLKKKDLDVI